MLPSPSTPMSPLSARIPSDLYLWLSQLPLDGAQTNSDKLRVLLGQLKRQHEGALDYGATHAWLRDGLTRQREALVQIEGHSGRHSEVLALLMEHLTAAMALLLSHPLEDETSAARLEGALVRRALAMGEALLRQAITPEAAAFDAGVVRQHVAPVLILAGVLANLDPGLSQPPAQGA
jgi:hypothetical protein